MSSNSLRQLFLKSSPSVFSGKGVSLTIVAERFSLNNSPGYVIFNYTFNRPAINISIEVLSEHLTAIV